MDEPLVSQPQTGKWLGRTRVALMSEARPGSLHESFHIKLTACIIFEIAVAHVNTLVRLCVSPVAHPHVSVPTTGGERHCLATVAVTQPVRVSSEGPGSCCQLCVWPLEQPKDLFGGLGTPCKVPHTLVTPKANPEHTC